MPRKVASVNMDGSNPEILVRDNLFSLGYLALDMEQEILYWSEGGAQKVLQSWPSIKCLILDLCLKKQYTILSFFVILSLV